MRPKTIRVMIAVAAIITITIISAAVWQSRKYSNELDKINTPEKLARESDRFMYDRLHDRLLGRWATDKPDPAREVITLQSAGKCLVGSTERTWRLDRGLGSIEVKSADGETVRYEVDSDSDGNTYLVDGDVRYVKSP